MTLRDRRREESERELRALLRREGVEPLPPDEEIAKVADFFARWGASALPMLRRAGEAMVREHQANATHEEGEPSKVPPQPPDAAPPT